MRDGSRGAARVIRGCFAGSVKLGASVNCSAHVANMRRNSAPNSHRERWMETWNDTVRNANQKTSCNGFSSKGGAVGGECSGWG